MYTCIAIDDEFSALELLTDYIADDPDLKLIKTYINPIVALSEITKRSKPVDIIFLDIEMAEINGLELAKLIRHRTKKLIFTTAHANYASNSYELEADDFLLKPILQSRFTKSTEKLFLESKLNIQPNILEFIIVKSVEQRNQFIKIKVADIVSIEAQERATKITTETETIFSNSSLSEILISLKNVNGFSQIHRSFIVAENRVKLVERTYVILNNGLKIAIGRRYSKFYQKMANKN
ncbi:LytR/AlgR family response regulator transcription factor [Pedobacter fastidiosus]|uniref:Response regulator transcription factor n=1 Tax=Pedobacter fastidiosus TaxID=2765361 RepID=A0ABR7KP16_9SPHI|nr:LytTR family DNA-binding domain-containing protein [Pedobacter fastidiosus]MBC6109595.1 response regulator transcription factor [Pedobacter fastidiosus]